MDKIIIGKETIESLLSKDAKLEIERNATRDIGLHITNNILKELNPLISDHIAKSIKNLGDGTNSYFDYERIGGFSFSNSGKARVQVIVDALIGEQIREKIENTIKLDRVESMVEVATQNFLKHYHKEMNKIAKQEFKVAQDELDNIKTQIFDMVDVMQGLIDKKIDKT